MASLIENLIAGLNEEYVIYEELLNLSMDKTTVIVANNLEMLKDITDREQELVDIITGYEFRRRDTIKNIGIVINKKPSELKISDIADFLKDQPEFRMPLIEINEKLRIIAEKLKGINIHNKALIEESLEMIGFNINLLQNLSRAPETANYSKDILKKQNGYNIGSSKTKGFDSKQ